jgi:transposase
MRGTDQQQTHLFSTLSYDRVIPETHPLRHIRKVVDQALAEMSPLFEGMYARIGRPSIPPERLIRALLIETLYSIRSDRQLVERLEYDLLTKWFVGLELDEAVWDASTFSRNRDRFLSQKVSQEFFKRVLAEAHRRRLLSQKHFSVDGTLIQAWASTKSVRPKDEDKDDDPPEGGGGRNATQDFHGQKRTNETHASTTDPEARLARKANAHPALPSFMGHAMVENRHGLVVAGELTQATGTAEREAALRMADDLRQGATVGADKAYDTADFRTGIRKRGATPHVAQNLHAKKHTSVDGRTTRHSGYAISLRRRKIVEEVFGWLKTVGNFRKARWIGCARIVRLR